jgi:hypothetical protein
MTFQNGQLNVRSYIRPNRLFTAERTLIAYVAAKVTPSKLDDTLAKLRERFS